MFKKNTNAALNAQMQVIDTIIGAGCKVVGDLNLDNSLKIDGVVEGNIHAKGKVTIGDAGKILGNIECQELTVFGWIQGNLTTEQLHLQATAKIIGGICTQNLSVENGAVYQGSVTMKNEAIPEVSALKSADARSATEGSLLGSNKAQAKGRLQDELELNKAAK